MKNLLIAAIAVFTIGASAQDVNFKSKRGENFLPEKGDWALGFSTDGIFKYLGNAFNGNLNNNAPKVGYSTGFDGQFVGKYFTTDKSAYRVIFNFSSEGTGGKFDTTTADNTVVITPTPTAPNSVITTIENGDKSTSQTNFSIGFGKEWRRGKTRLQGFYGADVLLLFTSKSSKEFTFKDKTEVVTTPAQTIKEIDQKDIDTKFGSGFGIGAQGFIGAEYFLFPKIAIGAQYTYGISYLSVGEGTKTTVITSTDSNTLPTPTQLNIVTTSVEKTPTAYARGFSGVGIASINLTLHF